MFMTAFAERMLLMQIMLPIVAPATCTASIPVTDDPMRSPATCTAVNETNFKRHPQVRQLCVSLLADFAFENDRSRRIAASLRQSVKQLRNINSLLFSVPAQINHALQSKLAPFGCRRK